MVNVLPDIGLTFETIGVIEPVGLVPLEGTPVNSTSPVAVTAPLTFKLLPLCRVIHKLKYRLLLY